MQNTMDPIVAYPRRIPAWTTRSARASPSTQKTHWSSESERICRSKKQTCNLFRLPAKPGPKQLRRYEPVWREEGQRLVPSRQTAPTYSDDTATD